MRPLLPVTADRLLNRLFDKETKHLEAFLIAEGLVDLPQDYPQPDVLVRLNAMIIRVVDWKYAPWGNA